ncbi:MAG: hypothetical protein IPI67_23240 [Myxococcales bacterium]|nr:hypothetical protein [Myxococcales bacterium]
MHALVRGARVAAIAVFTLTATSVASAEADDATKNAARELAEQAAKAMDQADYAKAQDLYQRAYALVPAPTLSLRRARALSKGGRWVEALEAYVRTTRTKLDASSSSAFREAVQAAQTELAELRPRVPRAKISVKGSGRTSKELSVTVDGKPLAAALIGVSAPIDPGSHELIAKTTDGREARATLKLEEKESRSVELTLPDAPSAAAVSEGAEAKPAANASTASSPRSLWTWVSFGVGAAGLGVGITTGLMANARHQSAEDNCPNNRCVAGSSGADDAATFRSLRTVSTIGYVVGLVGVGAGVTLWLTTPKHTESAQVGAFVGPGASGVRGTF